MRRIGWWCGSQRWARGISQMTLRARDSCCRCFRCWFLLFALPAVAQGTLEDYQRAERFLPGNLRHHAFPADVTPHWVEKTSRFWYRRATPKGGDFRPGRCGTEYCRARLRSVAPGCGAYPRLAAELLAHGPALPGFRLCGQREGHSLFAGWRAVDLSAREL